RFTSPDHFVPIKFETGNLDRGRTGSNNDAFARCNAAFPAVLLDDFDGIFRNEAASTFKNIGTIALQQPTHTTCELFNNAVLPILHLLWIDRHLRYINAMR